MATRTNTVTTPATTEGKDPLDGDFTYLATKEPGEVAALHAELITQLTGVEITAQQVQAVLSMHGKIQKSEANRKRAGYKPRTAQSIRKGGETTVQHFDEILAVAEAPKPAARKPRAPRKSAAQKKAEAQQVAVAS